MTKPRKNCTSRITIIFAFSLFFLGGVPRASKAQTTNNIDSLNHLVRTTPLESVRAYALDELSYEWFYDDLDSSLIYGQKAYALFRKTGSLKGQAQSSVSIAVAYHYKNNWDSAEYYYKKSWQLRALQNDSLGQAKSLNNLGVFFMDKGDLKQATSYFLKSLELRKAINDEKGAAMNYNNLGLVFRRQGNFAKAIEYYALALEYFESANPTNHLGTIYLNLGALHNYQHNYSTGLAYNLQALDVAEKLASERSIGEACVNASDSYLGLHLNDSSLYYAQRAAQIFSAIGDTVNLANAINSSAELYLVTNDYPRALAYSKRVYKLIKSLNNNELRVTNAYNLSEAYAGLGQMAKAHRHLKEAFMYKDSLLNESLTKSINQLTIQFETAQKERKIAELELNKKTAALALASSRNQRNVFILVAVIILLFSVFLYLLLRAKSKSNQLISSSLQEKETLLREIHHRVKNNLQVISSLLSLQAGSLEDDKAIEAVKEGQTRVRSMALIHEKLYSGTDLRGVNIQTYLEDLTTELFTTFGVGHDKIRCQINTHGLMLDIDTVIPLGLILNELITNVLKYAFEGDSAQQNLSISLLEKENKLYVSVQDDGKGIDPATIETANSFGWKMIRSLSRKLKAKIQVTNNNGTLVELIIMRYNLING